jgi:hypothetical protein
MKFGEAVEADRLKGEMLITPKWVCRICEREL